MGTRTEEVIVPHTLIEEVSEYRNRVAEARSAESKVAGARDWLIKKLDRLVNKQVRLTTTKHREWSRSQVLTENLGWYSAKYLASQLPPQPWIVIVVGYALAATEEPDDYLEVIAHGMRWRFELGEITGLELVEG